MTTSGRRSIPSSASLVKKAAREVWTLISSYPSSRISSRRSAAALKFLGDPIDFVNGTSKTRSVYGAEAGASPQAAWTLQPRP